MVSVYECPFELWDDYKNPYQTRLLFVNEMIKPFICGTYIMIKSGQKKYLVRRSSELNDNRCYISKIFKLDDLTYMNLITILKSLQPQVSSELPIFERIQTILTTYMSVVIPKINVIETLIETLTSLNRCYQI